MELYELVNKIESEEEPEYIPKFRPERKEVKVEHRTEAGKMVYEIIGKNAPPLFYAHSQKFVTDMLTEGYAWWLVESKLKEALVWCAKKGANHAGLRTVLKKMSTF